MAKYAVKDNSTGREIIVDAPDNATEQEIISLAHKTTVQKQTPTPDLINQYAGTAVRNMGPVAAGGLLGAGVGSAVPGVGTVAGGLAGMGAMGLTQLVDSLAGTNYVNGLMDRMGYKGPDPNSRPQQYASAIEQGISGAASGIGLANAVQGIGRATASPVVEQVGKVMGQSPGVQLVSGGGAGAGQQKAKEMGYGPTGQMVGGAIGGFTAGGAALLVGNIYNKLSAILSQKSLGKTLSVDQVTSITNSLVEDAAKTTGQKVDDIPNDYLVNLKREVADSLSKGKKLNVEALLRQKDFQDLGMEGTQGQITRDPSQFAMERNLRGVEGIGEPIQNRLQDQNARLHDLLPGSAEDAYQAGTQVSGYLTKYDKSLARQVSDLYKQARNSASAKSELDLTGLAQDYANIVDDFGHSIPADVKNRIESYGLISGQQQKVMTVDDAEKLIQLINAHYPSERGGPVRESLNRLRDAVKNAVVNNNEDTFSAGRDLAAKRFALQRAAPALEDAAKGNINPDKFVQKYVISATTDEVKVMSKVLDEASKGRIKGQIADVLRRAAFGEDLASDKAFSPDRYARVLRSLGDEKLSAIFTKSELSQLKTIGRVSTYIEQHPNASAVNTSNTGSAVANLATRAFKTLARYLTGGNVAPEIIDNVRKQSAALTDVRNSLTIRLDPTPMIMPDTISTSAVPMGSASAIIKGQYGN